MGLRSHGSCSALDAHESKMSIAKKKIDDKIREFKETQGLPQDMKLDSRARAMALAMVRYEKLQGMTLSKNQELIFHRIYFCELKRDYIPRGRYGIESVKYYMKDFTLRSDCDVDTLCFALERCNTATSISLDGIILGSFSPIGTRKIAETVARQKSLKSLSWRRANINDECVTSIARAFSKCVSLETLNLEYNEIGSSGAKELAVMLKASRSIKQIDLSCNEIGDSGTHDLAAALIHNKNITMLDIACNKIGDSGAQDLAAALIQNKIISALHLSGNNFGESGLQCIVDALLHNHHCNVSLGWLGYGCALKYMKEHYHEDDKRFSELDYAAEYLSQLNEHEECVEIIAFKKAMVVKKSKTPETDFQAWWFPVFHDVERYIVVQLWETVFRQVDGDMMRQVICKRKEIDLSSDGKIEVDPDDTGFALKNQIKQRDEYGATLKKVKTEKVATEDALTEAKEDIEDANELIQQQSLFTDKWQGKFDDLAKLAEEAGVDLQKINEIRYRS